MVKKPFYELSEDELRVICHSSIDSMEIWAKQLIHEEMSKNFVGNYLDAQSDKNEFLVGDKIHDDAHDLLDENPGSYSRPVDALTFTNICNILCNRKLNYIFKDVIGTIYPNGRREASVFLNRLWNLRDSIYHAGTISVFQAEQVVSYTDDFIEGLKEYYKKIGMEKKYNTPRIIRASDSFGTPYNMTDKNGSGSFRFQVNHEFRCNETYSVYIVMDPSFSPDEYEIKWRTGLVNGRHVCKNTLNYTVTFKEEDVNENSGIVCTITSKKTWHRFGTYDFILKLTFSVLNEIGQ